ncbi:uncharacterized protein [Populus alba]|uniref:MATH domain-containing protein n=2 Tax=Populus TaxID=3689 RepID=A0A4U5PMB6_POPAL|nr:uncharacterized protein LOC118032592 isoform X2 [Populus alba]KAJ6992560.1 hypothetical protein NC653_015835 [Populus alba x Populus x berolinensis]TKR98282.1 uncharacterized protein D5086_0000204170 [Populus alba]
MKNHRVKTLKTKTPKPISSPLSEIPPAADYTVTVDCSEDFHSLCKWVIPGFRKIKSRSLYSRYFQVSGYDFRFFMYPKGDSLSVPGHISLYLQVNDPCSSNCDCYACYKIVIVNVVDETKSLSKESVYRFSKNRKSIGWCEFAVSNTVLDANSGFLKDGVLTISGEIRVLDEKMEFSSDRSEGMSYALNGKVTWSIRNYGLLRQMVKTQKIISSAFRVWEAYLGVNLSKSMVNGAENLSLFLEIKDIEKNPVIDRSCWCLFRISVLSQKPGVSHVSREYYGRFGGGGDTSLGWTEFMKISDFFDEGYVVDDNVLISVSFNAIQESSFSFRIEGVSSGKCKGMINCGYLGGKSKYGLVKRCDDYTGKIIWKIENFSRLKDILKKKKMKGLCVKSRRFWIGNMEVRILVYPRGQSQKPIHLSTFLEVLDPGNSSGDWSSFIVYQLAVMNGKMIEKSVVKQSAERCSNATKNHGWSEFMTLTSLFDQDSGFIGHETAVFTAEVHILKETFMTTESSDNACSVTWKMENFLSFKEIMLSQRILSRFFEVGGCKLQIGIYQSSANICAYVGSDPLIDNFWVNYRITIVNQNDPAKSLCKESSLCTKAYFNADLQLMKVSDMLDTDAGFVVHETVTLVCEILDCCPWFEFFEPETGNMEAESSDCQFLSAVCQMDINNEECKKTFSEVSGVLGSTPYEALQSVIHLLFKSASQCQCIPRAVNVVRARLELLGAEISLDLLDLLGTTMNSQHEIAEAMLREIDCVFALDEKCILLDVTPCPLSKEMPYLDSGTRHAANSSHREDESRSHVHHYFSDIFILIDMLSIPSLTIEASGAFERGVAHGYIDNQVVALVLEKHAERFSANSTAREKNAESLFSEEFFTSVLALAETLSLSINSRVHNFVQMFYVTLFEVFSGESYHTRMLRGLVDLATSPVDNSLEMNLDVLIFLVHREHGFARPVLKMVGDAAKHDNTDHSAIRHRLCCLEEKIIHIGEEKRAELSNISSEKATLLERLTETEAALLHYKSEMELERDRFTCEKTEVCAHIQDIETQLEQLCSKHKDHVAKHSMEKRDYQDHLHHVETQLSHLKSLKHQELKKLLKEKEVLAERLRHAEANLEVSDRKLKKHASKVVIQEEEQQTQLDEIWQLKQKVEQIEIVKQDKEEEVAHYRACTYDLEAKLNDCQKHIQFLENAHREEMEQHAPLYGVGLESLSMESLENLLRIHEDGIKNIHALQHQLRNRSGHLVSSENPLQLRQFATYSTISYC